MSDNDENNRKSLYPPAMPTSYPPNPDYRTGVMLEKILDKVDKADTNVNRLSTEIESLKKDVNSVNITLVKHSGELENIKRSADDRAHTLNKIHDAIYDPDKGIYASIKDNDASFIKINDKLIALERKLDYTQNNLKNDIDNSYKSLKKEIDDTETHLIAKINEEDLKVKAAVDTVSKQMEPLVDNQEALVAIGGDKQLTNIKNAVEAHKNFNKLWWALILAVLSGFGKFVWDIAKDMMAQ